MIMGLPRLVTSDQGKEFNNILNKEFMKQLKNQAQFSNTISSTSKDMYA